MRRVAVDQRMIARGALEDPHPSRCRLSATWPLVTGGVVEDLDHGLDAVRPEPGQRGARAIADPAEPLADHGPVDAEGSLEMRLVLVAQAVREDRAAWPVPVIDALLLGKHWFGPGGGHVSRPPSPARRPRRDALSGRPNAAADDRFVARLPSRPSRRPAPRRP